MSVYVFPKLFVEGKEGEEYLKLESGKAVITREPSSPKLGKVPLEIDLEELVDLVNKETRRSFAVYVPKKNIVIYVQKGTPVKVLRVAHKRVVIGLSEGDEISLNETYAHGITSKGEYRRFRSKVNGIVVLVHWKPIGGEDVYHVIVADRNAVKVFEV